MKNEPIDKSCKEACKDRSTPIKFNSLEDIITELLLKI